MLSTETELNYYNNSTCIHFKTIHTGAVNI